MNRFHLLAPLCLTLLLCSGATLHAQDNSESPAPATPAKGPATRQAIEKEVTAAFSKNDYKTAEEALRRLVKVDADNFVPWYNLACALSMQGKTEEAGPMLEKAIELGFSDLRYLQADHHFVNLRNTENYQRLVKNWHEILAAHIDQRLERARKRYGPGYTYEKDEKHRLAYVSAFSAQSFDKARKEIESLIKWWDMYVCPPPAPAPGATPPANADTPWVLVILPTPQDYASWARARYGEGWERVGGAYSHDDKSLVAKDIGSTLRHEFWHVLHWRHQDVLGQRHPIWIMEGLCSLVEDIETTADGGMRPIPSWRTNQIGNLSRSGKITPWEVLFSLDQKRLIGTRPLALYAESRAIFMWLSEQGKLRDWYTAYTTGFAEDPTGLQAIEKSVGKPARKAEADFKAWLRKLPVVAEDFPVGSAVLPFDVDPVGAGDGLVVSSSDALDRLSGRPNTRYANSGGIHAKDVILTIDDRPVREIGELIRVLSDYGPGTEVTVTYRRVKKVVTTKVTLIEKR